jgi:hypothetical protein
MGAFIAGPEFHAAERAQGRGGALGSGVGVEFPEFHWNRDASTTRFEI